MRLSGNVYFFSPFLLFFVKSPFPPPTPPLPVLGGRPMCIHTLKCKQQSVNHCLHFGIKCKQTQHQDYWFQTMDGKEKEKNKFFPFKYINGNNYVFRLLKGEEKMKIKMSQLFSLEIDNFKLWLNSIKYKCSKQTDL